jgi:hypothetical protein
VIGHVQVVEVDPLGAEPLEALVARREHARARQPLGLAAGAAEADLGRDPNAITARLRPRADDALGLAVDVRVRGVDVHDAALERAVEDGERLGARRALAEIHRAEA